MPSVCFYASFEPAIGAGHLLRSIALAEETVKLGFNVHLLTEFLPSGLKERLDNGSITSVIADGEVTPRAILQKASEGFDIWVFDSYRLHRSFLSEFAGQYKTVMIDDHGECAVSEANTIVNPNVWATPKMYDQYGEGLPQFLCGPEFVLLRHEARGRKWTPLQRGLQPSILVAPGGTDASGVGPRVERSLQDSFNGQIEIRETFTQMLEPSKFVDALASVDIAVIGCGTTIWEAISIGVPIVGLLLVDNQEKSAEFVRSHGLAEVIDCREELPLDQLIKAVEMLLKVSRSELSATERSSSIIDGRGAERVAHALYQIVRPPS